jgi:hypothetical protein
MSSGSKKSNPDMRFLFLSKVPVNEPPPGSTTGPLWTELAIYTPLIFLIKIPLTKEIIPFSQMPYKKEHPSKFPKSRAPMETDAHFQNLI